MSLPERTVVDLVPADDVDELDDADRAKLHEALAAARTEPARGEGIPAAEAIRELRSPRR